jgi:hypothetical protein
MDCWSRNTFGCCLRGFLDYFRKGYWMKIEFAAPVTPRQLKKRRSKGDRKEIRPGRQLVNQFIVQLKQVNLLTWLFVWKCDVMLAQSRLRAGWAASMQFKPDSYGGLRTIAWSGRDS